MAGDAANHRVERLAAFDRREIFGRDFGALREIGVRDFQAALGLVDDIVEIILERNAGHNRSLESAGSTAASVRWAAPMMTVVDHGWVILLDPCGVSGRFPVASRRNAPL